LQYIFHIQTAYELVLDDHFMRVSN